MAVVSASILKTMQEGESHHPPGKWMSQGTEFHINRAIKHLADCLYKRNHGSKPGEETAAEDLRHAETRIGMADFQWFR